MNTYNTPNMNTNKVLSEYTVDTLQQFLNDSKTWVDFKLKCGLPKSRRQDGIRAYLDSHNLGYCHLPVKGMSGMQQKSIVWSIPEDQFREHVDNAKNWSDLLQLCDCETFGNIRTIRRRIKELGIDCSHLQKKNTESTLSAFDNDILQQYLDNSTTWAEFKTQCGLPKSRRQAEIDDYLENRGLNYSHLSKSKRVVRTIPIDKFRENVINSKDYNELLEICGCGNLSLTMVKLIGQEN